MSIGRKRRHRAVCLTRKENPSPWGEIIGIIIAGAIIGALARLFMKGDQNLGVLWTIILGALGAFVGGLIVLEGILHWILGIVLAMVFIAGYMAIRGRSKTV